MVIDDNLTGTVIYSVGVQARRSRVEIGETAAAPAAGELLPIGKPIIQSRTNSQLATTMSGETWGTDAEAKVSDVLSVLLLDLSAGRVMLEAMKTDRQGL